MFNSIHNHYKDVAENLRTRDLTGAKLMGVADVAIVPIGDIHKGTLRALLYARRLSKDVRALCVITDDAQRERLYERWNRFPELTEDVQLICINTDFRDVLEPVIDFITRIKNEEFPDEMISVVLPEFISPTLPTQLLHNQSANILRMRLRGTPGIIVIDIPFHINSRMRSRVQETVDDELPETKDDRAEGELEAGDEKAVGEYEGDK